MSSRVGSDIGGTFTDIVIISEDGATFEIGKVLTTPDSPDEAVVTGIAQTLAASVVFKGSAAAPATIAAGSSAAGCSGSIKGLRSGSAAFGHPAV